MNKCIDGARKNIGAQRQTEGKDGRESSRQKLEAGNYPTEK